MSVPQVLMRLDSARARRHDYVTSHEAVDSNDIAASSAYVLHVIRTFGPLADHELVHHYDNDITSWRYGTFTPQRLRTARSELTHAGYIEATGIYRLTESKRRAIVWASKEQDA